MESQKNIIALLTLLRPTHYLKNFFVFLPPFFGMRINEYESFLNSLVAFACFCIAASTVYIFNDIYDHKDDSLHPVKKLRPIASGRTTVRSAVILCIVLANITLFLALFISRAMLSLVLIYFFINICYSIKLKHIPLVDLFLVASGFLIRITTGSIATGIPLSMWIIIMTFLLALLLAVGKRRDDVLFFIESGTKTRKVIDGYSIEFLNASIYIMASVIIVAYTMYTISPSVMERVNSDKLYITGLFVLFGVLRYLQVILVENKPASPTTLLIKDRFIQSTIVAWIITFVLLMY